MCNVEIELFRSPEKAGVVMESAVDQAAVTLGTDYKRIDKEAQEVAKQAVAALHQKSAAKKSGLKAKSTKSASILEKIRARRDAKAEASQPMGDNSHIFKKSKLNPNYKLAQKLRDYLQDRWSASSDDIVSKFDGHIKSNAVFKVCSSPYPRSEMIARKNLGTTVAFENYFSSLFSKASQ